MFKMYHITLLIISCFTGLYYCEDSKIYFENELPQPPRTKTDQIITPASLPPPMSTFGSTQRPSLQPNYNTWPINYNYPSSSPNQNIPLSSTNYNAAQPSSPVYNRIPVQPPEHNNQGQLPPNFMNGSPSPTNNVQQPSPTISSNNGIKQQITSPYPSQSAMPSSTKGAPILNGISKLALGLNRAITSMTPSDNVIFSPLSITSAMALLLLGAKSHTAVELSTLLGLRPETVKYDLHSRIEQLHQQLGNLLSTLKSPHVDYELDTATAVFPQIYSGIKQEYINNAQRIYGSEVLGLDYAHHNYEALATINQWVSDKTHGKIARVLPEPPHPNTQLIVANALYFNGNWEYPFPERATRRQPFYIGKAGGRSKDEKVFVDLMANSAEVPYFRDEQRKLDIMGLPYKGKELHMYVILPDGDLEQLMRTITEKDLHALINSTEETLIIYGLPKMKLESNIDLYEPLSKMGVTKLFNPETANLRNIADEKLYVDSIVHAVQIDINEIGTTAAAATATFVSKSGSTPTVRVDKPFLFVIHHKPTDTILFWGKIVRPTPSYAEKEVQTRRFF